jgi:tRNA A-37 threonylcarbamoyl transferase component Bud32
MADESMKKMAEESVKLANEDFARAMQAVDNAEADLKECNVDIHRWNKILMECTTDPKLTGLKEAKDGLNKAEERLKEAEDSLKEAKEDLNKARAFYLQVIQLPREDRVLQDKLLTEVAELRKQQQRDREQQQLDREQQQLNREEALRQHEEIVTTMQKQQHELVEAVRNPDSNEPLSDGALGESVRLRLERSGMISDAKIDSDEDAFWSKDVQDKAIASARKSEAAFDVFITPYFDNALASCGMVFINSERNGWLSQSKVLSGSTDLKPDGFATHRGMYYKRREPKDGVTRPTGLRYGVPVQALLDCIVLFESKLIIDDVALGQVVRYLRHVKSASAILFSPHSFWLIQSHKGFVMKVTMVKWVDNGSKNLFLDFINANKSPWITALTEACSKLKVDVFEGNAFLGCGAFGRVFKVKQGKKVFALKIVHEDSTRHLFDEARALSNAQHTGLAIRAVGACTKLEIGAALLLSPVGKPLPPPRTRSDVSSLFILLKQLHLEKLAHGDPRVPNVILYGKKRLWIDLAELEKANPYLRTLDAELLTQSILNFSKQELNNHGLKQLIKAYGKSTSKGAMHKNLNNLINQVC